MSVHFDLLKTDSATAARRGRLRTRHGMVETPIFMPVGTYGAVKSVSPDELETLGAQIILGNTYHLYLRPGHERVDRLGELHRFMNWDGPILTDSGGFQVFSLARYREVTEQGVTFKNKLDGAVHTYNDLIGSYEGRVLVQARKLRDLGAATGDEIPIQEQITTQPRALSGDRL